MAAIPEEQVPPTPVEEPATVRSRRFEASVSTDGLYRLMQPQIMSVINPDRGQGQYIHYLRLLPSRIERAAYVS